VEKQTNKQVNVCHENVLNKKKERPHIMIIHYAQKDKHMYVDKHVTANPISISLFSLMLSHLETSPSFLMTLYIVLEVRITNH